MRILIKKLHAFSYCINDILLATYLKFNLVVCLRYNWVNISKQSSQHSWYVFMVISYYPFQKYSACACKAPLFVDALEILNYLPISHASDCLNIDDLNWSSMRNSKTLMKKSNTENLHCGIALHAQSLNSWIYPPNNYVTFSVPKLKMPEWFYGNNY